MERVEKLYLILENQGTPSLSLNRFKYLLQKHFSHKSEIIPKVDQTYINDSYNRIFHSTKFTSYDLEFLGDFTTFLSLDQLKILYPKLIDLDIDVRKFHNSYFHKYTAICLVNFTDIFIDNNEYEKASVLLSKIKKYAITFGATNYLIWYKYLSSVMEIYKEKDQKRKNEKLERLGNYIHHVENVFEESRIAPFFKSTYQRLLDRNGYPPKITKFHYLLKG